MRPELKLGTVIKGINQIGMGICSNVKVVQMVQFQATHQDIKSDHVLENQTSTESPWNSNKKNNVSCAFAIPTAVQ